MANKIKCYLCHGLYPSAYNDPYCTQGWRCASTLIIKNDEIIWQGGHGSTLTDMDMYKITDIPLALEGIPPKDNVCDGCFLTMAEQGVVKNLTVSYMPIGHEDNDISEIVNSIPFGEY